MQTHQTPEQIIASAMQLPVEQRKVIAQELLQSISVGQDEVQELNAFLSGRIEEAERGELSEKNFSQIKHEARLDS